MTVSPRVLAQLWVGLAAMLPRASASETFDRRLETTPIVRSEDLVWALAATCDRGDDGQQRQCRQLRDRAAARYAGEAMVIAGDAAGFSIGGWNAARRSTALVLDACIACDGIELTAKRYAIVGGTPRSDGTRLRGATVHDSAKVFGDEASAKAWLATTTKWRVDYVVKLAAKPRGPTLLGRDTIAVDVVAWRVVNLCDGSVIASSEPAAAVAADKQACAKP